ncbi:putative membrane protein [Paratrimastix pyriformis]|uniref:Membrane protein n=1 Tax=Paratrimastix pyriformis TaxID=342808 RepID=A0ABQ8ULF5_9EUKA|nr:putative membrane protein [Paratrimastix pyriformis]
MDQLLHLSSASVSFGSFWLLFGKRGHQAGVVLVGGPQKIGRVARQIREGTVPPAPLSVMQNQPKDAGAPSAKKGKIPPKQQSKCLSWSWLFVGSIIIVAALAVWRPMMTRIPIDSKVKSVSQVDLGRYLGKWYEIGRMPFSFENKCVSDVTAEYQLLKDGRVSVVNSCTLESGERKVDRATAEIVPGSNGSQLKVCFFWPFKGDYWVMKLHPEYQWSLVGEPKTRFLWLLSRTPTLPQAEITQAVEAARAQGYDVQQLIWTKHSAVPQK